MPTGKGALTKPNDATIGMIAVMMTCLMRRNVNFRLAVRDISDARTLFAFQSNGFVMATQIVMMLLMKLIAVRLSLLDYQFVWIYRAFFNSYGLLS